MPTDTQTRPAKGRPAYAAAAPKRDPGASRPIAALETPHRCPLAGAAHGPSHALRPGVPNLVNGRSVALGTAGYVRALAWPRLGDVAATGQPRTCVPLSGDVAEWLIDRLARHGSAVGLHLCQRSTPAPRARALSDRSCRSAPPQGRSLEVRRIRAATLIAVWCLAREPGCTLPRWHGCSSRTGAPTPLTCSASSSRSWRYGASRCSSTHEIFRSGLTSRPS